MQMGIEGKFKNLLLQASKLTCETKFREYGIAATSWINQLATTTTWNILHASLSSWNNSQNKSFILITWRKTREMASHLLLVRRIRKRYSKVKNKSWCSCQLQLASPLLLLAEVSNFFGKCLIRSNFIVPELCTHNDLSASQGEATPIFDKFIQACFCAQHTTFEKNKSVKK